MKNNQVLQSILLLIFYSTLAYLPLIPFLGFYSEDFFFSYLGHFYGIEGIIRSNSIDRPFDGYLLALSYFFLRDNTLLWHLSTFSLRLLSSLILFFALKKIWPSRLQTVTIITLLFSIYPGFLQQTLPLGYQVYPLGLIFWNSSLLFTILTVKSKKPYAVYFTVISLVLQIMSFANLEFFVGLEALRILLIVYLLNGNSIGFSLLFLKKTLKLWRYWVPYILGLTIFVLWRIFIFKSTRDVTSIGWIAQTYYSDFSWIVKIPLEMFLGFFSSTLLAFIMPLMLNLIRLPFHNSALFISIGLISSLCIYPYLKNSYKIQSNVRFGKQLFIIGVVTIIAAIFPIIITGRPIRLFSALDRYTITSMIGAGFIFVGFLSFKFNESFFKVCIILLVAISVTSHLMNSYWHKIMWDRQQDFWWQLYWRAPSIQPDSMLILDFPELSEDSILNKVTNKLQWQRFYWAEEQIWSAGNLFLNYRNPSQKHFYGDFLMDSGILEKIKQGKKEIVSNRNIIYTRDFTKSIIIDAPSDISCLKIEKGENLIRQGPANPPPIQIFGPEPKPSWCYYFQKASLVKQYKDWGRLADIKKIVLQQNLKPQDPSEWLVFEP